MKTKIGALSLLAVLVIVGMFVVKELHNITLAAGDTNVVLPTTATDMSLQQEYQAHLIKVVEAAMKKTQAVDNDK